MKFVSYRHDGQVGAGVVDVDAGLVRPVSGVGDSDASAKLLDVIAMTLEGGASSVHCDDGVELELAAVELLAPIPVPTRNIMCVGKNYKEHSEEFSRSGFDAAGSDDELPTHPIFFTKPPSAVVGPGASIEAHTGVTDAIDYEAEVAVIIGRPGRSVHPQDAWDHVWGYTLLNDVTARDLQRRHKQWFLGKSLDTFCPMGPWAVTSDEVRGDDITIECRVNGEVRQQGTTRDLIFDIPTLISTLSAGMTLKTGDIIATGTPVGVGIGFNPPKFLQPGDIVEVSSPQLGSLRNSIANVETSKLLAEHSNATT